MHPNPAFRWTDDDAVRDFIRAVSFAAIFAATPDGPRVAHAPLVWTGPNQLGFHLARGNALTRHIDGTVVLAVVSGPDAYISPDWYDDVDHVPTWNYRAVEIEGRCRRLDDDALVALLDALSDEHEARLAPKPLWKRDKLPEGRFEARLRAIAGFEIDVGAMRATAKLGQKESDGDRHRVADALDAAGHRAVAALMRGL
jgi:transcriptional regulator